MVLPASAWPEKDGTVTNTNRQVQMGRKALPLPGEAQPGLVDHPGARQAHGLELELHARREVYPEMASMMPALDNISWERVEREDAVTYPSDAPDKPGRDVVFDKGFPRPGGFGKLVAAKLTPPDETPDHEYPFILTTGRQLEHWHTGSMTRRATVLDAIEPRGRSVAVARHHRRSSASGRATWCGSRRGAAAWNCRRARTTAMPDGVVFIPFAYVEAAANLLTNPALDPFGKIPEFKFCAAKVEAAKPADGSGGVARSHNLPAPHWPNST